MNCRRVEDLIPLYVGSDLERSRRRVLAHLNGCSRSEGSPPNTKTVELAAVIRAARIRRAFLDRLRASALKQIERNNERPAFFRLMADAGLESH